MASIAELFHRMFNSATGALRVELVGGGGGGPDPSALLRDLFSNNATIPTDTDFGVPWNTTTRASDVLDLTDTALPLIKQEGVWALSVFFHCSAAAGKASWGIEFDRTGDDVPQAYATYDLSAVNSGSSFCASQSLVFYLPAGAAVYMFFRHDIGSDHAFHFFPVLQQLA